MLHSVACGTMRNPQKKLTEQGKIIVLWYFLFSLKFSNLKSCSDMENMKILFADLPDMYH